MNCMDKTKAALVAAMGLAVALAVTGCNRADEAADATPAATSAVDTPAAMEPTPAPAPPATAEGGASQFAMMDTDSDGKLSAQEHATGAGGMFVTMDTDGNGSVSAAEMDAAQPKLQGDARMSSADKIKTIDTNADGVLTREEHDAGSRSMFDKMDADHDGSVTAAEMQSGHDKMMGS